MTMSAKPRPRRNPFAPAARAAAARLAPLDAAREAALTSAREVVRLSSRLIRTLHAEGWDADAGRQLGSATQRLTAATRRHPGLVSHGAVQQAYGEAAEAHLLKAFLEGRGVPTPTDVGVPAAGWLLGLADLVGELRRVVLNRLRQGDDHGAEAAFDAMEKAYEALEDIHAPEGVVPLRSKVDADRALVERTRGDLVTAKRTRELERKIEGVGDMLDQAEGRPAKPRRARKAGDGDLDLDKAWSKQD